MCVSTILCTYDLLAMNNWQPLFNSNPLCLTEHLKKPYFQYDNKEKEITNIIFDNSADLIWASDTYGRISSYTSSMTPYSRYTGHIGAVPVQDAIPFKDVGILSISEDSLHLSNKKGVTIFNLTSVDIPGFSGLRTMCLGGRNANTMHDEKLYLAGINSNSSTSGILQLDLNKPMVSMGSLGSKVSNNVTSSLTPNSTTSIDMFSSTSSQTEIISYSSKIKKIVADDKFICIARQSGVIDLLDPNSNTIVKSFPQSHSGMISSIDSKHFTLATTGKSKRFNSLISDPFVNLYDLRAMKQLSPVSFSKSTNNINSGADFVQFHPLFPTVIIVASENGSFDFIDLSNPTLRVQYLHPCKSSIRNFKISPNGDHIAFLTNEMELDMWNRTNGSVYFNNSPDLLDYPDYIEDGPPPENLSIINEDNTINMTPLSSIGMPYYTEKLLSSWSQTIFRSAGSIPYNIDKGTPSNLSIGSSVNPAGSSSSSSAFSFSTSPSQPQTSSSSSSENQPFPLIRYNKSKYGPRNEINQYFSIKDIQKKRSSIVPDDALEYKPKNREIPPAFSKLLINQNKFGSDGLDYKLFNNTKKYSGLEPDYKFNYTNAIIQLYRFIPEFSYFLISSLKNENLQRDNLLIELGYLYDMFLHQTPEENNTSRSTNFQMALQSAYKNSKAGSSNKFFNENVLLQGLKNLGFENSNVYNECEFDEQQQQQQQVIDECDKLFIKPIQEFNSFLLHQLILDELKINSNTMTIEETFGFHEETTVNSTCSHYKKQSMIVPTLKVLSPTRNGNKGYYGHHHKKLNNQTILPYIEQSMKWNKRISSVCDVCNKKELVTYEKTIKNLPPVFSLELIFSENEWSTIKNVRDWLSKEFYALIFNEKCILKTSPKEYLKYNIPIFKYELSGFVCSITDFYGESRSVTYVKIFDEESKKFKWYLFNDYLVEEVDEEEALNVTYWWKKVEIATYCDSEELRKPHFEKVNDKKRRMININDGLLYKDYFINGQKNELTAQYELLTKEEAPKPGTLVAIDAEFVVLSKALEEIDCMGRKNIIRPTETALARLSVIRGEEGPKYGVPFIDDYIRIDEPIVDYLTRYSGIKPGDLDYKKSDKALVSREATYRKVWLLLQLGCVFVGHGLSNDFKHININVPKEQIRDTSIYFLKGKRYLSLRYLAHALLDRNVQEGNHDSIEDAHTALILYKKYLNLKENGTLEHVLDVIYEEGRASNYKVPSELERPIL